MNERIRVLKHQASVWCDENIPEQFSEETNGYGKAWEDKFAELIVRECIDYMNYRTKDWDAKLRWIFNDGSGYMDVDVDSLLKKHFGVEE